MLFREAADGWFVEDDWRGPFDTEAKFPGLEAFLCTIRKLQILAKVQDNF